MKRLAALLALLSLVGCEGSNVAAPLDAAPKPTLREADVCHDLLRRSLETSDHRIGAMYAVQAEACFAAVAEKRARAKEAPDGR